MLPSLSKLKSINKPILRDEVYLCIKEGILAGEIAPGERISIGRLLKEIGFSPTSRGLSQVGTGRVCGPPPKGWIYC